MTLSTQPYKGTRDFYPDEMRARRWMFQKIRREVESFGYQEYDGPMLEPFELYAAKTGEEIVNQQLYWLMDKGDRKLAVRPEMTPTLARMVAGKIHELPRPIRWYSIPNLWRYERPQRGRLREHWQLNVDVLGGDPVLADAEVIRVAYGLVAAFGGENHVSIRINHRGLMEHVLGEGGIGLSLEVRLPVFKALDARAKLPPEKFNELLTQAGVTAEQAHKLEAFLNASFAEVAVKFPSPAVDHLAAVFKTLESQGITSQVQFDPSILRGMDYYTGTVFEIFDESPENRRAMFGGGRYDNLVGLFGKHTLSGIGFGMGDVTFRDFLDTHQLLAFDEHAVDVYVTLPRREDLAVSEQIARDLRAAGLRVVTPLEVGTFGTQLKQAVKVKSRFVVLLGESELTQGKVQIKRLSSGEQALVLISEIAAHILLVLRSSLS